MEKFRVSFYCSLYFDLSRHMKERGWRIGDELSDFPL